MIRFEEQQSKNKTKKSQGYIILNDSIRLLATTVMAKIFIGVSKSYEDISAATYHIVPWLTEETIAEEVPFYNYLKEKISMLKRVSDEDKKMTSDVLKREIYKAIANEDGQDSIIKAMKQQSFTHEQINAMVMTLFVAGQDNVSNSLTHILLKLAQDPVLQDLIFFEKENPMESPFIRALICESLRMMCPIGGISRIASKNLSLVIKDKRSTNIISKTMIKKGDSITAIPFFAAKDPGIFENPSTFDYKRFLDVHHFLPDLQHSPFGYGPHMCPGWYLYYVISAYTVYKLVKGYKLETSMTGEPKLTHGFVTGIKDKIPITIKPRKKEISKQ